MDTNNNREEFKNIDISNIELIVYDFDGVMTNNKVILDQDGKESVIVNRSDGLAISEIKKLKIPQIIISTEENPVVRRRADKLKIECYDGIKNKLISLKTIIEKNNIDKQKVVYIGNDLNDKEAMKFVGIPIAPNDAHQEIKNIVKFVTKAKGGDGVIRELLDILNEGT